jgi:simple sugar transport system permease protein
MNTDVLRERLNARRIVTSREGSVLLTSIALSLVFTSINAMFVTGHNFQTIGELITGNSVVAAGQVMLMVMGDIDLSVGAVYALTPTLVYLTYTAGMPLEFGIPLSILAAVCVGFVNGIVTVGLRVPALITTLGMNFVITATNVIISRAYQNPMPGWVCPGQSMSAVCPPSQRVLLPLTWIFGGGSVFGIEISFIWTALAFVILAVMLARMRHGLWSIATGGNTAGAKEVGVNVNWTKVRNFVLCATIAGIWGLFAANRDFVFGGTGLDNPLAGGDTLVLESIASAAIGGTSLFGGSGTVIGAFFGSLLISVLQDGLFITGANVQSYDALLGIAIIFSMVLNMQSRRRSRQGG